MARYAKFFSVGGGGGGTNNLQLPIGTVLDATLRQVQDGTGTGSPLYLSINRVGITADPTVTTQTSSVIQATTTNANLVIAPNGTGALVADIPDGTATGGNARGTNAVDLQQTRIYASEIASGSNSVIAGGFGNQAAGGHSSVLGGFQNRATNGWSVVTGGLYNTASGNYSFLGGGDNNNASGDNTTISGGSSNTASSTYATVSGGQSNTAGINTHATVVGGFQNTASGGYSVSGGFQNTASNVGSISLGYASVASGSFSTALGLGNYATAAQSTALGVGGNSYLARAVSIGNSGSIGPFYGVIQQTIILPYSIATLNSAATTVLSIDGTGVTNLIIPNGNNRLWAVKVVATAFVSVAGGTLVLGDSYMGEFTMLFKRVGGTSSVVGVNSANLIYDTNMATAAFTFATGASQDLQITFKAPTTASATTFRCVAKVELVEVAY